MAVSLKKPKKPIRNKMAKKNNKTILMIGAIIVIGFLVVKVKPPQAAEGVSDRGVALRVFGVKDGVIVGELKHAVSPQAVVQYDPVGEGPTMSGIDAIILEHTVSQGPLADVDVDVNTITGSFTTDGVGDLPVAGDGRYDTALDIVTRTFTLLLGVDQVEQSDSFNILDLVDDCDSLPYCTFKLQLNADYEDIDPDTGLQVTTTIPAAESFGSIVLRIDDEECSDGTPFGFCSVIGAGGKFCDGAADLIDCADPTGCTPANYPATSCTCNSGYVDVGGVCMSQDCVPGECTGTLANRCDPACATQSCAILQDCYECGQAGQELGTPLGWLDATANAAECPLAYDGVTPADSCHDIQHTCKYKGRAPDLTITLQ